MNNNREQWAESDTKQGGVYIRQGGGDKWAVGGWGGEDDWVRGEYGNLIIGRGKGGGIFLLQLSYYYGKQDKNMVPDGKQGR